MGAAAETTATICSDGGGGDCNDNDDGGDDCNGNDDGNGNIVGDGARRGMATPPPAETAMMEWASTGAVLGGRADYK